MTLLEERIRTGLHETAERIPDTAPNATTRGRRASRLAGVWIAAAAIAAVLIMFTPILLIDRPEPSPADSPSPFLGTWVSIDADLSTPTMVIEVSTEGIVKMVVVDEDLDNDFASVCSGAPSTMTGTGSFQGEDLLVFPSPVLTCDDGSQPRTVDGSPIGEQYRNLTFTYRPESDTLIDNFGERWTREGVTSTPLPLVRWPQASEEEVAEAQLLADAGDPNFTWQLEPNMESLDPGQVPELLARAVQKRFGWKESALIGPSITAVEGFHAIGFQLVRCDPGKSNPLWPNDAMLGGCAPTIDDFTYEMVDMMVAQPAKQGPEGIWVVSAFPPETGSLTQTAPITDDEVAAIVEAFLQARITGEGAEQNLGDSDGTQHFEIGLLYATTTGAPYERGEFEMLSDDQGPFGGGIGVKVSLFAESGQTVVEQTLVLETRLDGSLALYQHGDDETTENGVPQPRP